MSEAPPDFRSLARRYLDLWQEQVAASANDPALAEAVARGIAMMTQAPAAFVQAATAGAPPPVTPEAGTNGSTACHSPADTAPSGAAAVAAASGGARGDAVELARRVAQLEERVAVLEAELGRRSGGAADKPRRRRT